MSARWESETPPVRPAFGGLAWLRIALRAMVLAVLVFGGLAVLLLCRLLERPLCGLHRPVTPHITCFVCRNALRIMGMRLSVTGAPLTMQGAVVANHSSWLDIFALNAVKRIYFVSKSEVAHWPGIGWLARRRSMASQISPDMLEPLKRSISWMPVGEVTLISVR